MGNALYKVHRPMKHPVEIRSIVATDRLQTVDVFDL